MTAIESSEHIKNQRPLIALIGCTASGKSDLALRVAQRTGAHIVSCDSLLVYRDLNIGTAKPSASELSSAPHHAINLIAANENFTAGDFVRHVRPIIDQLLSANIPVLVVGGTGFYLKALLYGIWDAPPTNSEFRMKLEQEITELNMPLDEKGPWLHRRLEALDSHYAAKVSPQDVYRLIRALEIMSVSGKTVTEQTQGTSLQNPLPHPYRLFGIRRNSLELEKRIVARTNAMFAAGLVAETKALLTQYPQIPKALRCVGYNEILQHFEGKMTLDQCRERIVISTRQLAKKQRTFFRAFPETTWFDLPRQEDEVEAEIFSLLTGSANTHRVV